MAADLEEDRIAIGDCRYYSNFFAKPTQLTQFFTDSLKRVAKRTNSNGNPNFG